MRTGHGLHIAGSHRERERVRPALSRPSAAGADERAEAEPRAGLPERRDRADDEVRIGEDRLLVEPLPDLPGRRLGRLGRRRRPDGREAERGGPRAPGRGEQPAPPARASRRDPLLHLPPGRRHLPLRPRLHRPAPERRHRPDERHRRAERARRSAQEIRWDVPSPEGGITGAAIRTGLVQRAEAERRLFVRRRLEEPRRGPEDRRLHRPPAHRPRRRPRRPDGPRPARRRLRPEDGRPAAPPDAAGVALPRPRGRPDRDRAPVARPRRREALGRHHGPRRDDRVGQPGLHRADRFHAGGSRRKDARPSRSRGSTPAPSSRSSGRRSSPAGPGKARRRTAARTARPTSRTRRSPP